MRLWVGYCALEGRLGSFFQGWLNKSVWIDYNMVGRRWWWGGGEVGVEVGVKG